jgi:hypothetical protein
VGSLGVGIFLSLTLGGAGMRQWQHLLVLVQDRQLIWKLRRLLGLGEMTRSTRMTLVTLGL